MSHIPNYLFKFERLHVCKVTESMHKNHVESAIQFHNEHIQVRYKYKVKKNMTRYENKTRKKYPKHGRRDEKEREGER